MDVLVDKCPASMAEQSLAAKPTTRAPRPLTRLTGYWVRPGVRRRVSCDAANACTLLACLRAGSASLRYDQRKACLQHINSGLAAGLGLTSELGPECIASMCGRRACLARGRRVPPRAADALAGDALRTRETREHAHVADVLPRRRCAAVTAQSW